MLNFYDDTPEVLAVHIQLAESLGIEMEIIEAQTWEKLRQFDYNDLPSPSNLLIETLYNKIGNKLLNRYPAATSLEDIGFEAYANNLDSSLSLNNELICSQNDYEKALYELDCRVKYQLSELSPTQFIDTFMPLTKHLFQRESLASIYDVMIADHVELVSADFIKSEYLELSFNYFIKANGIDIDNFDNDFTTVAGQLEFFEQNFMDEDTQYIQAFETDGEVRVLVYEN